jgi:hypothetical protein
MILRVNLDLLEPNCFGVFYPRLKYLNSLFLLAFISGVGSVQ